MVTMAGLIPVIVIVHIYKVFNLILIKFITYFKPIFAKMSYNINNF